MTDQVKPSLKSTPETPLASSSPGGGGRPWLIMGILVLLIGGGLWVMSSMKKSKAEKGVSEKEEEIEMPEVVPSPKPREKVETTVRPAKSEMNDLSAENREKFLENIGKWVFLRGKVKLGNEEGLIEFESPAGVTAQLVRGTAAGLTGKDVELIAWMISEEKAQVDGVFDITVVEAGDLLPEKDIYTREDVEKLISLRNDKVRFEGKVREVRASEDEKSLYLIFEGDDFEFYGRGAVKSLEARGVTLETLGKLVGKTLRLQGKLIYEEIVQEKRLYFDFSDENAWDIMD